MKFLDLKFYFNKLISTLDGKFSNKGFPYCSFQLVPKPGCYEGQGECVSHTCLHGGDSLPGTSWTGQVCVWRKTSITTEQLGHAPLPPPDGEPANYLLLSL